MRWNTRGSVLGSISGARVRTRIAALLALTGCGPRGPEASGTPAGLGCPALFDGSDPLAENLAPQWRNLPRREDVYLLSSEDAVRWTLEEPAPLLHAFTSLGLWVEGDRLYLFGNSLIRAPFHPTVTALSTADLRHWTGCAWPVTGGLHGGLVDAQAVRGPGGRTELLYYAFPRADGAIDPAILPGPHEIWRAVPEQHWLRALGPVFGLEYLTDPSVVWFQGRYLLAGTQRGTRVVFASSPDGEAFDLEPLELEGASVPHLQQVGDELWLLAQRSDRLGRALQAFLYRSPDGRRFEPQRFLLGETAGLAACASPVAGRFQGLYVLFCVQAVDGAGPGTGLGPGPGAQGAGAGGVGSVPP